jgi:integrase
MPKSKVPSLRLHKPSGRSVVRLNGKDHYLGVHGSAESEANYHKLIARWLAGGRQPLDDSTRPAPHTPAVPPPSTTQDAPEEISVVELVAGFLRHLQGIYPNHANSRSVPGAYRPALALLVRHYGREPAHAFGPKKLKQFRELVVARGYVRSKTNLAVNRVRAVFRWGSSEELIPANVYHALQSVENLKRGLCACPESRRVMPVALDAVEQTLGHLTTVTADLVRLQLLLGCRPSELFALRPCDVDTTGDVWVYTPESHKTERYGRVRQIAIGPRAQEILRPYLDQAASEFCFSPAESERQRRAERHAKRRTPLNCGNSPGSRGQTARSRPPGHRYSADAYRRSIARACQAAGIPAWSPYRLRHARATEIRRLFGLDAVQSVLGHAHARTSEIYASVDVSRAMEIQRQIG